MSQKTSYRSNKNYDDNYYKKWTWCLMDFSIWTEQRVKIKESEMIDKYLDFAGELWKDAGDTNCCWCPCNGSQRFEKWTIVAGTHEPAPKNLENWLGDRRKKPNHQDYTSVEIRKDIWNSPWGSGKLAVIQTLVKKTTSYFENKLPWRTIIMKIVEDETGNWANDWILSIQING